MKRSELLSLAISIFALVVSVASWLESHYSRQVAKATSRASLHFAAAQLRSVMRGAGELDLEVRNAGQSLAKGITLEYRTRVVLGEEDAKKYGMLSFDTEGEERPKDVPPGSSWRQSVVFKVPPQGLNADWPTIIGIGVKATYVDDASGETFSDDQFFTSLVAGSRIISPEMVPGDLPSLSILDKWRSKSSSPHK